MSVATIRLISIVLAMKVVSAANAHPATAGIALVLTTLNFPASRSSFPRVLPLANTRKRVSASKETLTAKFGKDAVRELANTHKKIVMIMNHLVLSNLQAISLAHCFSPA